MVPWPISLLIARHGAGNANVAHAERFCPET
jgi:hypothetical protein